MRAAEDQRSGGDSLDWEQHEVNSLGRSPGRSHSRRSSAQDGAALAEPATDGYGRDCAGSRIVALARVAALMHMQGAARAVAMRSLEVETQMAYDAALPSNRAPSGFGMAPNEMLP